MEQTYVQWSIVYTPCQQTKFNIIFAVKMNVVTGILFHSMNKTYSIIYIIIMLTKKAINFTYSVMIVYSVQWDKHVSQIMRGGEPKIYWQISAYSLYYHENKSDFVASETQTILVD